MNELIKCGECLQLGKLRLDTYPQVMVHDRGPGQRPKLCTLPPPCWVCLQPGKLRLDTYPQVMVHDRGPGQRPKLCTLPPRDIVHPERPRPAPRAGWDRYPNPYKEAS